jgi:hypothetical protein
MNNVTPLRFKRFGAGQYLDDAERFDIGQTARELVAQWRLPSVRCNESAVEKPDRLLFTVVILKGGYCRRAGVMSSPRKRDNLAPPLTQRTSVKILWSYGFARGYLVGLPA